MGDTETQINHWDSQADDKIPIDYFVTKQKKNKEGSVTVSKRKLRLVDASGNLVFTTSSGPVKTTRLLLDASGNLLFSLHRINVISTSLLFFIYFYYIL